MSDIQSFAVSNCFKVNSEDAFDTWLRIFGVHYRRHEDGRYCLLAEDDWDTAFPSPDTPDWDADEAKRWVAKQVAVFLADDEVLILTGASCATGRFTNSIRGDVVAIDHTGKLVEYDERQLLRHIAREFDVVEVRYGGVDNLVANFEEVV